MKHDVSLRDYIDQRFDDHRDHVDERFDDLKTEVKGFRDHNHAGLVSWAILVPLLLIIIGIAVGT